MAKYSTETKLNAVKMALESGFSLGDVVQKTGISKSEIKKWVAKYRVHGIKALEKERFSYSGEFKKKVVEDMRKNNLSLFQTATKYNLGNHDIVSKWERIYLEEGTEGLFIERRGRANSVSSANKRQLPKLDKNVEEDLIAENQRLRMEIAYLKKLNALVAEREIHEKRKKLK